MENAYNVLIPSAARQMLVHWLRRLSCVFFQALVKTTLGFPDVRFAAAWTLDSIDDAVLLRIRDVVFYTAESRQLIRRKHHSDGYFLFEIPGKFPFKDPGQILAVFPQVGDFEDELWGFRFRFRLLIRDIRVRGSLLSLEVLIESF